MTPGKPARPDGALRFGPSPAPNLGRRMVTRTIEFRDGPRRCRPFPHFLRRERQPLRDVRLPDRIGREQRAAGNVFSRQINENGLGIPNHYIAVIQRRYFPQ